MLITVREASSSSFSLLRFNSFSSKASPGLKKSSFQASLSFQRKPNTTKPWNLGLLSTRYEIPFHPHPLDELFDYSVSEFGPTKWSFLQNAQNLQCLVVILSPIEESFGLFLSAQVESEFTLFEKYG